VLSAPSIPKETTMTRSSAAAPVRADIYSRVTNRIIADLENGVRPWLKPWNTGKVASRITKPLRGNGQPYKGINIVMLWGEAIAKGYASPTWLTYRQAAEHGGQVRKGEHGLLVVYADRIRKTDTDDNGEEIEREIPFLKGYTVFNAEQIDGLPERFYAAPSPAPGSGPGQALPVPARIDGAERFVRNTAIAIRHGGDRAFYMVDTDCVRLPPFESFTDAEAYYATVLHEIVHATRHPSRLAREFGRKRGACPGLRAGGDEGYAAEELVAEIGAAFLCADLAITPEPRTDHAAYIASWLAVLKNDKRAIFTAAAHAQRAADFLHALQLPEAG
jgi:antirestriction protein ArdC